MSNLTELLKYARHNSQYYREVIGDNIDEECLKLTDFPILTKEVLRNRLNDILTDNYHNSHIKMLKMVRTSGSTGKMTELYWNYDEYNMSNLSLWRLRYKWYGISPTSKKVVFNSMLYNGTRIAFPPKIKHYKEQHLLGFSKFNMSDEDIKEYINAMRVFKPDWISVQTSILLRIIEVLEKYDISLPPSLRYIELAGEYTPPSIRKRFDEFFKIPIANMYGAVEVNAIAYECPHHHMHILEDNVFVEVTSEHEILVTSLRNKAVPIIRYHLGDYINIEDDICDCGYIGKSLHLFGGRTTDRIKLKDDSYITPYTFLYCIEKSNAVLSNAILQYKIIQTDWESISINLVIHDTYKNWKTAIIDELNFNISKHMNLDRIRIDYKVVSKITDFHHEKFKIFESRIKESV